MNRAKATKPGQPTVYVELTAEEESIERMRWSAHDEKRRQKEHMHRRKREKPSPEEQLEMIAKDGVDAWKIKMKAVDDKYPAPA